MSDDSLREFLAATDLLRHASPETVANVAADLASRPLKAGEVLFAEGDPASRSTAAATTDPTCCCASWGQARSAA